MKSTRSLGVFAVAVTAALATIGATTTAAHADTPSHTVAGVHAHVDARAQHITSKMQAMKTRVTANPRLTPASKTTVNADIAKVLTTVAAWRKQIDAATTMVAIKAALPAREAVMAALTKLRADLKIARANKITG